MSKRLDKVESLRKLRGIYSDALRAASCSGEFIALGQSNTPFLDDWGLERRSKENAPGIVPPSRRRSGCSPAGTLSSCATDRLSARNLVEINQWKSLTYRIQSAPRSQSARRATFDNQQGKDVKAKQHWCPLKQDHLTPLILLLAELFYPSSAHQQLLVVLLGCLLWIKPSMSTLQ